MARTKNTDGTVKESPKGSGWYRAILPPRLSDTGQRPYLEGRWRTKTAARRALNIAIADLTRGHAVAASSRQGGQTRRVRDAVREYIALRANHPRAPIAVRTVRGYKSDLKNHINNPNADIGNVPVSKLTARRVERWLDELAAVGTKPATADVARRLLSAAMSWEVKEGRVPHNVVKDFQKYTSKASRSADQAADTVVLPSWEEFAALVSAPQREEDRLLIAVLGWAGLRWSEATSLVADCVWLDRPVITISQVLTKRTKKEQEEGLAAWVREAPKAGLTATVPVPTPLWRRIKELAAQRRLEAPLPEPAGQLLFRPATTRTSGTDSIGMWDNTNFRRQVWSKAVKAARLEGDKSLPLLDPRRKKMKTKDLRAFAASVLLDSGATRTEAAALLRHANTDTTEEHYTRAMVEKTHDRARREAVVDKSLDLSQRLDALWAAWAREFPDAVATLGIADEDGTEERHLRAVQ